MAESDHDTVVSYDTPSEDNEKLEVERVFDGMEVPPWRKQLTFRAMVVSLFLGIVFSFIVMKLNLTTGLVPSLNISAGLLGFFFIKLWIKVILSSGVLPFTRQENTVIQTCVVACAGIASSGGFGSYLSAMSERTANATSAGSSQTTIEYKNPSLSWMIPFLFVVSFTGLFSVVPLRKIMIIDFKLTYPSGTATAHLINSFHTPEGAKLAKKQVRQLWKFFSFSFMWSFFQWFYTAGDGCGFSSFPTLGLQAYKYKFYFDFSATYVGVGMICPYIISISALLGGIISWGLMWPLIETKKGDWYSADSTSMSGLLGYQVFVMIAMILGDGLYNLAKALRRTLMELYVRYQGSNKFAVLPSVMSPPQEIPRISYDDQRRKEVFLNDRIPVWVAVTGYVGFAVISMIVLPHIFHQLKWYYILVIYLVAPILAFCNAYGSGLTDFSLASIYGILIIFIIGAWAGASHGGVLAGLAACGVMFNIASTASDLLTDFKTGYLTLTSPRSMFVSQVIGTAMGCIISPCVFWVFYKAFSDLGLPGSQYPSPYATIYRSIADVAVQGFSALPKHCLTFCYASFAVAILVNAVRDSINPKYSKYVPFPMAMAIPFYVGPYFAIDMCIGSLILFIWSKVDKAKADAYGAAAASGLICGDGIWTLPSSVLALAGAKPPICMKFLSRSTNARVDAFLNS
ncbi:hypothetical protein MLD38_032880 [Melastoma candidum]|uniref:Uncharacterized protein n=1 Tax=Melastoma candidum TaxID=119954 RepID=A0ACB9M506_9MYRT|nr:hypothetical protein MLD38_032880 [Melastoma candidum]